VKWMRIGGAQCSPPNRTSGLSWRVGLRRPLGRRKDACAGSHRFLGGRQNSRRLVRQLLAKHLVLSSPRSDWKFCHFAVDAGAPVVYISKVRRPCMTEKQETNGILEDFRLEFLAFWNKLPNKGFFLVLLAAWLALFHFLGNSTFGYIASPSLLRWMHDVYKPSPFPDAYDDSHARLLPFLVLGLMWWKRKELVRRPLRTWPPGLWLLALALLLHLAGYSVQQPRISIVALFVGLYGLMGLAWGPDWLRASFFPFCLFVFCVPVGTLALTVTFPLRLLVCWLVQQACSYVLAIDILRDGTFLKDPTGHYGYDVAPACSGMRSLVATLVIAIVYGMLSFRTWWKRGL